MKKLIIFLLVLTVSAASFAQVRDAQVERIMTERVMSCDDIYYNSILLIPRLYRENKTDTAEAVLSYWNRNCGMNEASVAFSILYAIKNGNFREEILNVYHDPGAGSRTAAQEYYKKNIISYLTENYNFYEKQNYPAKYPHYYFEAYVEYSNFIRWMAGSLIDKPGLTQVEKFLVDYYSAPDPNKLYKLYDSVYNGTVIQQAFKDDRKYGGLTMGLTVGTWIPQGKLDVLGSHLYWGFNIGGCTNRLMYEVALHLRAGSSANYYTVKKDDSIYNTNYYLSYYLGADFGYALTRSRVMELAVLGGIGFDGIDVVENTSSTSTSNGASIYSLNLNAGLGYKIFLSHRKNINGEKHSYLNLQAKYNFVGYNNRGGTDLTGNAITVGLTYGGLFKFYHKYYEK